MNALSSLWLHAAALHLWQATLFGLVISLCIVWLPAVSARVRHFAGCLALLRFILPAGFLASLFGPAHWLAHGGGWLPGTVGSIWLPVFFVSGNDSGTPSAVVRHFPTATALTLLWGVGTILLLGAGMVRLLRGMQAVKQKQVPFAAEHQERLEALAIRVGLIRGSVTGCYVPSSGWLGVTGLFRSRVIVPEGLFTALDDREVDAVLLHELMHVKRHDNLLRLFQSGVVALFWFHPLVWWLDRQLRWESERACDDGVLRLTEANRVYASGLFKSMRFALGLNLPGVSGMSRLRLQSRIQAVLNHQNRKESPVKLALTVSTLVGFFGLATLMASTPAAPNVATAPSATGLAAENSGAPANPASADNTAAGPAEGKILELSELDQIPVVRTQARPMFPAEKTGLKEGIAYTVNVGMVVDEQGKVAEVKVVDSTDQAAMDVGKEKFIVAHDRRFDQAAMDAVRQWTFSPGLKGGKPVNVRMSVAVVFSIAEPKPGG